MNGPKRHGRQWKGIAAWLLLAVTLLWLWVTGPTVATAHAILLRSIPEANAELAQPPATIEMWFSEPLEEGFSTARLLDSQGQEVPTGAVNLDPSDHTHMSLPLGQLEPGIYTVAWQTLSQADGHEWYGSFPLTLLNPDGSRPTSTSFGVAGTERGELPTPGEVISRWLVLLGSIMLFGVPLFQIIVVRAGRKLPGPDQTALATQARDLALRAIWIAVVVVVAGSGLQIILQALRLGGLDQLPTLLLETRTGRLALVRLAVAFIELFVIMRLPQPWPLHKRERPFLWLSAACGVLVIGLLLFTTSPEGRRMMALVVLVLAGLEIALARFTPQTDQTARERGTWYVLLALSGVTLLTLSLGSHANAVPGNIWAVLGDYVHLVAAAAWVGGLTLLPVLIWQVRRAAIHAGLSALQPLVRRDYLMGSLAV
jgi:methionine-rich copper-binding protein CopC/putative copper export protein